MRIGIVTHNYPAGKEDRQNAGIFVYDFAGALQDLGHEVFVLSCGKPTKNESNEPPVTWFTWPGFGKKLGQLKFFNPLDLFSFIAMFLWGSRATERFIRGNKIDFMVGMWTVPAGFFTMWGQLRQKVPYCLWSLGSDTYVYSKYPILGNLIKLALKRANFLLADGIDLAKQTSKIAKNHCEFIPSASQMPQVGKSAAKKAGPINLMFLGRMELVKGPDVLINAVSKLRDLDFKLHCLGDGSLLPTLKHQVEELGLGKKVVFYGNVNDSKVIYSRLLSSDWLIVPSRSDSIPLVFSESMKAGLPVIVADAGDMVELVKKYKVGLSFPKEDSEKLAEILKRVISRGRIYTKSYQQKAEEAARIFDVNSSARSLVSMIKEYGLEKECSLL